MYLERGSRKLLEGAMPSPLTIDLLQGASMKGGVNLRVVQQERQRKEEEDWVRPQPCIICNRVLKGAYGHHHDGWTCSGSCEKTYDLRPKYPGHTEEDFLKRFNLIHC